MVECKNCGTENHDHNEFCLECGEKIVNENKDIIDKNQQKNSKNPKQVTLRLDQYLKILIVAIFGFIIIFMIANFSLRNQGYQLSLSNFGATILFSLVLALFLLGSINWFFKFKAAKTTFEQSKWLIYSIMGFLFTIVLLYFVIYASLYMN
jgi:hypothetical protein